MTASPEARRTSLYESHLQAGGRLVDFAGWSMPVQYAGVLEEHHAVRTAAGLFDVSHMGEVRVSGPGAEAFLQWVTPNDVSKLKPGRAHYSALLTPEGTYIDDLLVYRLDAAEFLLVVNAANRTKDVDWLLAHCDQGTRIEDLSDQYALLALQGPAAAAILQPLTDLELSKIRYYRFARGRVDGVETLVSRTGYTGEDGFELYVPWDDGPKLWARLLEDGAAAGLQPAGLGARDTLRLEAAMALYGHEIDDTTNPWDAGLDWTVKLGKGDFLGRDALLRAREAPSGQQLVGFEVQDRGIARQGHTVLAGDAEVGRVTSGTFSPTFKKALGLAYVPAELADVGQELTLGVRSRRLQARVVPVPFYKRSK